MTHIHLPDGVLPWWVWLGGLLVAGLWVTGAGWLIGRRSDADRRVPMVAVIAALMVVSMSIPIPLLGYHVNLSVVAGALLGPLFSPIAAAIVQLSLLLTGHGGVTTVGLNLVVLSIEMLVGWALVLLATRISRGKRGFTVLVGMAVVLTLALSTTAVIGIVSTAGDSIPVHQEASHDDEGVASNGTDDGHAEAGEEHRDEPQPIRTFAASLYALGSIGWVIEAAISALVLSFIGRVRPQLLTAYHRADRFVGGGERP